MKAIPLKSPGTLLFAIAMATCWLDATVWACSTPVYRYAMYNWASSPYEVYYFHHGDPAKEDAEVFKLLTRPRDPDDGEISNLLVMRVDPQRKEHLNRLPPWVQKAWEPRAKSREPLFLIMTPWGAELFAGRLDVPTLKSMLDSPLRRQIAKLMHEGNAALLLVVAPSSAAKKVKKAEKLIDEIIARVGASTPASDDAKSGPSDAREEAFDDSQPLKIARLTISPNNRAEKWLVRMLMLGEEDLEDEADKPMVFPIFGRGRVLPPLVGEGITDDNLMECMAYISGPCSCQIKDQNIGGDLLMTWNWEATAEQWAADEPMAEPLDPFDPVPVKTVAATTAEKQPEAKPQSVSQTVVAGKAQPSSADAKGVPEPAIPAAEPAREQRAVERHVGRYAVGLGVAVLVVLAGGWLMVAGRRG